MKYLTGLALASIFVLAIATNAANGAQEEQSANSTSITKKLFTYAGPLLPSDWSL